MTDDLEPRLRRALADRADTLAVGEPPAVRRGAPSSTRPRRLVVIAIAAALLVLGAATAVWVRDHRAAPTPTDRLRQELAHADPLYALTDDHRILRIDPRTQKASTVHLSIHVGQPYWISPAPNGDLIVTTSTPHPPACTKPEIIRLRPDGTTSVLVPAGRLGSISPDGTRLAYLIDGLPECGDRYLVVRDLATGAERRWLAQPNVPEQQITSGLAWSPDGRSLAFGSLAGLRVLDLDQPGDTLAGSRQVRRFRAIQMNPAWNATTGHLYGTDVDTQEPDIHSPLQELDPASGRIVREVVHDVRGSFAISPGGLVAYTVGVPGTNGYGSKVRVTDGRATITLLQGRVTLLAW